MFSGIFCCNQIRESPSNEPLDQASGEVFGSMDHGDMKKESELGIIDFASEGMYIYTHRDFEWSAGI